MGNVMHTTPPSPVRRIYLTLPEIFSFSDIKPDTNLCDNLRSQSS